MVQGARETTTGFECSRRVRTLVAVAAIVVVAVVLVGRLTGPMDLHDQTQEKTSAYTTNLALHMDDWQHWVLPMQQATWPATKPPLYNWLAAPVVWLTDGESVWAHRLPSIVAFLGLVGLVWFVGRRIDPGGLSGAFGVMALSANYAMFKLSGLVRPDTLLTLWISIGWVGLTILSASDVSARSRRRWSIITWSAMALAGLTKGPAALVLLGDVLVLGLVLNPLSDRPGGWRGWMSRVGRSFGRTGAWWGAPVAVAVGLVWLFLVWRIDPDHAYGTLLREEFIDRATGRGALGVKEGPWDLARTALNMPWYFLTRWLPWSVLFIGAMIDLRTARRKAGEGTLSEGWSSRSARLWVVSGLAHTLVVIGVFTLSAGKRADYIAPAYVSGALVVAWCAGHMGWRLARRKWGLAASLAILTSGMLVIHDRTMGFAVRYPLGEALHAFARQARPIIADARSSGTAVEFYRTGSNPLQALLYRSQAMANDDLRERIESNGQTWLFANTAFLDAVRAQKWAKVWRFDEQFVSQSAQGNASAKPFQVGLYLVRPVSGNR